MPTDCHPSLYVCISCVPVHLLVTYAISHSVKQAQLYAEKERHLMRLVGACRCSWELGNRKKRCIIRYTSGPSILLLAPLRCF